MVIIVDEAHRSTLEQDTLGYWTYYDVVLTQMRALFIENKREKDNYTVQNFLIQIGIEEYAEKIDNYLSETMLSNELSLRDGIKLSVDKFIVRNDNVTDKEVNDEKLYRSKLTQANGEYSIGNILI